MESALELGRSTRTKTVLVDLLQTNGTRGGIEVYSRELYRAISNLNVGLEFVGIAGRKRVGVDFSWFPGRVIHLPWGTTNRLLWAISEMLIPLIMSLSPKVSLVHCPAMLGPLWSRAPLVLTIHDLLYFSNPELIESNFVVRVVRAMERRVAKQAQSIITISAASREAISLYMPKNLSKTKVIPLASRFASSRISAAKKTHFLAMGQRSTYKDFPTILHAWKTMPSHHRPKLVITGSHGDDPLLKLVEQLGLTKDVDLRAWVSDQDLKDLMACSYAIIDSTKATGFSLPAIEAKSLGIPQILADTPVFREVGGKEAFYFEPGNPTDLARIVIRYLEDFNRGELNEFRFGYSENRTWEEVAKETLTVFCEWTSSTSRQ